MNINFPVIELIDRLAIAEIKFEKTQANQDEVDFYRAQFAKYNFSSIDQEFQELKTIHSTIWGLEADLKAGKEDLHSLEEIGRRAIAIRDWNNKRVRLKNSIAEKFNCDVREIKVDHLSQ